MSIFLLNESFINIILLANIYSKINDDITPNKDRHILK